MAIGLLGYGKMGKAIEKIAEEQGIAIAWRIGRDKLSLLRQADVVIEFTSPESAFPNVCRCLEAGVPVISGTTGWAQDLPRAADLCREKNGAMLWASNFSVGVNLFFALNRYLATLMSNMDGYRAVASETHHIHKLDAPSGTAIGLLEQIIAQNKRYQAWKMTNGEPVSAVEIPITAIRSGEVPGTHEICWQSSVDEICITHRAHNREGFARGAILAAQWIKGRNGVFTISDVLGL
jgi:4-hydroxy-tetrahydrodipicolinate reductase